LFPGALQIRRGYPSRKSDSRDTSPLRKSWRSSHSQITRVLQPSPQCRIAPGRSPLPHRPARLHAIGDAGGQDTRRSAPARGRTGRSSARERPDRRSMVVAAKPTSGEQRRAAQNGQTDCSCGPCALGHGRNTDDPRAAGAARTARQRRTPVSQVGMPEIE
jgi:hypothetical protein